MSDVGPDWAPDGHARSCSQGCSHKVHPAQGCSHTIMFTHTDPLILFGEEYESGDIDYGILEKSNNGTLLLDEISEIPLDIQSNILRTLTDQKFKRINGSKDVYVDIRIIASTSKDLKKMILEKKFREDLYHRLNVVPLNLPTLQSRTEDIPLLISYFKKKVSENDNSSHRLW